jgi:putative transposase
MTTPKTTATLADIAAALSSSKQAVLKRAAKESWPYQEETVRGGKRRLYPLASLPKPVAQAVFMHQTTQGELSSAPDAGRAAVATENTGAVKRAIHIDPATLNTHQRETDYARRAIREFVESYPGSVIGALTHLNIAHVDGTLSKRLAWAYANCHDKVRHGQTLNKKTYYNWLGNAKERGSLAPAKIEKQIEIQPWHLAAVALKQRPQGSTLTWIHEQLEAHGYTVSYHQVARFFRDQFSAIDQLKGRYTGSKLRSHKFYQHRTSAGLAPADEVHADGWNTHFSAPHPSTGEFVTYEVWHFHDVATRYVTPPGLGLTEQFEVISKGLENYMRVFGRPQHVQTDSTKIVKGSDRFTKAAHSLEERIGCTIVHPKEVGNSQANGICENFNSSWLDKQSRALATYQNPKQMDELSFKRVKKLTSAMVKAAESGDVVTAEQKHAEAERMGKGRVLRSHQEAIDWLNGIVEAFNDRPHRSLKKVRGEDGKLRHQTPREALAEHVANGWEPVAVDEDELIDLFRPLARVKVQRETVTPYGGMRYRNPDVLGHWNDKLVIVSYDIHDWRQVWVKTEAGEPICTAEFVAATGYRAQSARDAAEEKRAKAQIRSLENKIKRVEAERLGGAVIEHLDANPDGLISARDLIDLPASEFKREALRDVRDVLAELDAEAEKAQPTKAKKPAREMTWEETKMFLYGGGKDLREEEEPLEEVAAG